MMKFHGISGILLAAVLLATTCGQAIYPAAAATPRAESEVAANSTPVPAELVAGCATNATPQVTNDWLIYHLITTDQQGNILPWYNPENLCDSYDHVIRLVFEWWLNMERNPGEPDIPYYLMHMIWLPPGQYNWRGLGGDQLAMAMSSWRLYYAYSGDARAIADMVLMANHVLDNGLSPATDLWPNIPYPYNVTDLDKLTGDMLYGEHIAQPDKAGSLGYELVYLYKLTGNQRYLQAAVNIADTLANPDLLVAGNETTSPLPFRVNTLTGESNDGMGRMYTTNFTGTLMLWEELIGLQQGNLTAYSNAHELILNWLRTYPVHNNDWGPFFEDGSGLDTITQINAVTLAMYIMEHRDIWGPTWQTDARFALDWPINVLINNNWSQYGLYVINEQTGYMQPGNSHTSRQASMELRYAELTGDTSRVTNAVRQLSWATYMVDFDGKNRYPNDEIWLTDGYGDYVRHFLRAMAAAPGLAPDNQDHLLRTTSVITNIDYQAGRIEYHTFEAQSQEKLKITTFSPLSVTANGIPLPRLYSLAALNTQQGYTLGLPGDLPTVMRIRHDLGTTIVITGDSTPTPTPTPPPLTQNLYIPLIHN
mgnify:CR=1 FL=1